MDERGLNRVVEFMTEQKLVMATAESCTAGLIVSELVSIPGTGQLLDSGLVVYSPEAKQRYLDIDDALFEQYSLTSEVIARAMAQGALNNTHATVTLANTGVAGPSAGDDGTPVGTVCFAWAFRFDSGDVVLSETCRFDGDRNEVRMAAAHYSLNRISHYHQQASQSTQAS
ncbi:CinA family protein [Kushneria phosphatilytica]|uniref:CinA family protein n=1 Tax=Kushneria phosphatilytica TaxID=657387 RepID=A0A1S1NLN6_9GAMM|nr:CinA family protein [Kushneria phosphatilytica]OHV07661.1 ompetence-damaged protein [Kushneria phosphatilytica]QEL10153.1 CinA family protein [Kushneria phosphatilytica]